ncbi:hypothetical protein ACC772_40105, partial [Rhizobium ruizarguesonis]
ARMARHNRSLALASHYDALVARADEPATALLAEPATNVSDPRTAEIVRHAARLTVAPRAATRTHVETLRQVGVTAAD